MSVAKERVREKTFTNGIVPVLRAIQQKLVNTPAVGVVLNESGETMDVKALWTDGFEDSAPRSFTLRYSVRDLAESLVEGPEFVSNHFVYQANTSYAAQIYSEYFQDDNNA